MNNTRFFHLAVCLLVAGLLGACQSSAPRQQQVTMDTVITSTYRADSVVHKEVPDSLLELISQMKYIPIELLSKHHYFEDAYLDSMQFAYGFGAKSFADSITIANIDLRPGECGERYLVTIHTSDLMPVAKVKISTFCDADEIKDNHRLEYTFSSDSTFETRDVYFGEGKKEGSDGFFNLVYRKTWLIKRNGEIEKLSSSKENLRYQ